jgi:hypothetical protein
LFGVLLHPANTRAVVATAAAVMSERRRSMRGLPVQGVAKT